MGKVNKNRNSNREREVYKVNNWSSYNKSLVNRGDISIWLSEDVQKGWYHQEVQKPGGELRYSDSCIEFCLTIKSLFGLSYRATQGFIRGLFKLSKIELEVPCYSQMKKRSGKLEVNIRVGKRKKGPIDLVMDSTGLKVYGEGEWKVRKHGWNQRRTWRLMHMGSDGSDLEIVCVSLRGNNTSDSKAGIDLMEKLSCPIRSMAADGAYDTKGFRGCLDPDVEQLIPPRRDGVDSRGKIPEYDQRDESVKRIKEIGRKEGKKEIGYHKRSLSEVNMYRYKKAFGEKMTTRTPQCEQTEVKIKCKILNRFVEQGMPSSYKVG